MRKLEVVLGLALLAGIGILVLRPSVEATARDPREVLGRVWFDRYPKSRNEEIVRGAIRAARDRGADTDAGMDAGRICSG